MNTRWYCTDCDAEIDPEEIDTHDGNGHHVRGVIRPDRLLPNDPWQLEDTAENDD